MHGTSFSRRHGACIWLGGSLPGTGVCQLSACLMEPGPEAAPAGVQVRDELSEKCQKLFLEFLEEWVQLVAVLLYEELNELNLSNVSNWSGFRIKTAMLCTCLTRKSWSDLRETRWPWASVTSSTTTSSSPPPFRRNITGEQQQQQSYYNISYPQKPLICKLDIH